MKKTLETFIDPENIPKKYGGKLDFKFGDMPVLDPAIERALKWEGDNKAFPGGPMFWVHKKVGGNVQEGSGNEMEAIAVGSSAGKERRERICTITKMLAETEVTDGMNGHATASAEGTKKHPETRPEFLSVPTAHDGVPTQAQTQMQTQTQPQAQPESESMREPKTETEAKTNGTNPTMTESGEQIEVQEGDLVPASRPEPVRFVTASDGLESLTLNEKSGGVLDDDGQGKVMGPHLTQTANLLDPNVSIGGASKGLVNGQTGKV